MLKYSQIKELCNVTGCSPTELNLDEDWLICDEDEALERVTEYIKDSCVYFRSWFLSNMTELPEEVFEALQKTEDERACLAIIEKTCGLDAFVQEAIRADGMGHFLSSYDGEEIELTADDGSIMLAYKIQ